MNLVLTTPPQIGDSSQTLLARSGFTNAASMGLYGFKIVTSTAAQTGNFCALCVVSDSVFSSITGQGISGTWSGTTIPAGIVLPGTITGFQLVSGSVVAFLGA